MKIAIINESNVYNYATEKMANLFLSQGHEIVPSKGLDMFSTSCDKAFVSVIFSYDIPKAIADINILLQNGVEVEVGGPAPTSMAEYLYEKTGIHPHLGLDARFENIPGNYQAVFTSRGCPRACEFCIVQLVEGRKITEYTDFPTPVGENPWICDNNILSTTWKHQKMVVDRLKTVKNLDFNSGFDDRIFIKNMEKYWELYSQLDLECWRFAFDSPEQREPIRTVAEFLHSKGVEYRRISVFCLIGHPNYTMEEDLERLRYLIDLEVSPYPMRYRPLNSLERNSLPTHWKDPSMIQKVFNWAGVAPHWRQVPWEIFSDPVKWDSWKAQKKFQTDKYEQSSFMRPEEIIIEDYAGAKRTPKDAV